MKNYVIYAARVFGLIALLVLCGPSLQSVEARPLSNQEVRRAVSSGHVVPYPVAIQRARAYTRGGDVLRAKLLQDRGRLVYRLRMLLPNGRVMKVIVDGASGRVIGGR